MLRWVLTLRSSKYFWRDYFYSCWKFRGDHKFSVKFESEDRCRFHSQGSSENRPHWVFQLLLPLHLQLKITKNIYSHTVEFACLILTRWYPCELESVAVGCNQWIERTKEIIKFHQVEIVFWNWSWNLWLYFLKPFLTVVKMSESENISFDSIHKKASCDFSTDHFPEGKSFFISQVNHSKASIGMKLELEVLLDRQFLTQGTIFKTTDLRYFI